MSYQHYLVPELFRDNYLFQVEVASRLPLRLALLGLACHADKAGRFRWKPQELKQLALPYDDVDFDRVMEVLADKGFLVRYSYEGHLYAAISAPARSRRRSHRTITPIND